MTTTSTAEILALDPAPDGSHPAAWRYRADPPARRVIMPAAGPAVEAGAWLVTTGAGVEAVLRDGRPDVPWPWALTGHGLRGPVDFITLSGPEHRWIRRFVDQVLPRERHTSQPTAAALAAALEPGTDLIARYCTPLMRLLAVHLGFPLEEWNQAVQEPTNIILALARSPADEAVMRRRLDDLLTYCRQLAQAKLRRPDGTVLARITAMMHAAGANIEIIAHTIRVLATGSVTPGANLAAILRAALARPGLLPQLAGRPDLVPQAASELMRLQPYGLMNPRRLDQPLRLADDFTLPVDEPAIPSMLAACHDPARFPKPDVLDLSRPITTLPWGLGPHSCPAYRISWEMLTSGLGEFARAHPGAHLTQQPVITAGLLPSADVLLTTDAG